MYVINKEWKEFNISLKALDLKLRADYPNYMGNDSDAELKLYFSSEPSQEEKDTIDAYYESLDGSDYVSDSDLKAQEEELEAAILAAKQALVSKTWANMSTVERKIAVGLKPTREEMGL